MIRAFTVSVSMILGCYLVSAAGAEQLTYEQDIRPIFRAHCFDCHGASEAIEGELDLRLVRLMIRGGDSGAAIVAGKPDESLLLDRVRSGDMPPGPTHLSDEEIETIERWISSGGKTARPEPVKIGPGLGITPEERSFWSFQPIHRPTLPVLPRRDESLNIQEPIDLFVVANGHEMATQADRRTLVIRAYFDLIGLPPTPVELQGWIDDPSDKWFDHLLDTLLASPHYGERWGRHWLDVAGYADSEGYSVADTERPWSWKYRDWVIRALNEDKPFDQFLTEQLAGDELAGPINGDLTANQIDLLTATGYLRMAADGTGSGANNSEGRNQVMIDTLQIIGTSLFGLSLQCAQCHDHRYDPIPQSDYYAMRAIFEPALDWKAWKPPAQRLISLYTAADRQKAAEVESEAQEIAKTKAQELAKYMQQALDQELMKYDQPLRDQLRTAYQTVAAKRDDEQKKLLAKNPSVNITPGNLYQYIPDSKPKLAEFDKQIQQIRSKKPAQEFVRALVEPPSHQPETRLFHRGDFQQPKQLINPATFTVTSEHGKHVVFSSDNEQLPTSGRRLAFARWVTSRENPLLARVIVNRIWMHHFGTGIVNTPADFGKLGARPNNLPLLDWLADELMTQGWSLKTLHRTIMSSATYRQRVVNASQKDYAGRRLQRLEAEAIRDRMLATTGRLDPRLFGRPVNLKEDDTGQIVVESPQKRRSLYLQVRRSRPVAMMSSFDAPTMETNCEMRSSSTVATQSLMMLNGQFILDRAIEFADRVAEEGLAIQPRSMLPDIDFPKPLSRSWQYGFGSYDQQAKRTDSFTPLTHWNNNQWQAGPALPDPKLGWVLLNAQGGHPGDPHHAVVRRWTAQANGSVKIDGKLSHPSTAGDGVRGRIVSSSKGILGEWTAKSKSTDTIVSTDVSAGDTIDFITDCQSDHNSDSFSWPVTMAFSDGSRAMTYSSANQFSGPSESVASISSQIIRVWELAYCRRPTEVEYRTACRFIAQQLDSFRSNPAAIPEGRTATQQAMTNLCQSVLSSNEFLYIE
ncbi:MAG: DUF1549 domain-containing protein [Rubripirellula sp.]|nr:DUF1549 domain-containing protein [Rubripirellula sp.]